MAIKKDDPLSFSNEPIIGGKIRQSDSTNPYHQSGEPAEVFDSPSVSQNQTQTVSSEKPKKVAISKQSKKKEESFSRELKSSSYTHKAKGEKVPFKRLVAGRPEKKWTVRLRLRLFPTLYEEIQKRAKVNDNSVAEEMRSQINSIINHPPTIDEVLAADDKYRKGFNEKRTTNVNIPLTEQMIKNLHQTSENLSTSLVRISINDLVIAAFASLR